MPEIPDPSYLEKFRDSRYPFVYWIDDELASINVINNITSAGVFGLETGFGKQPTKLFFIDPTIPWLLTEIGIKIFNEAKRDLGKYWGNITIPELTPKFNMLVLKTPSTQSMVTEAHVLVYRNLDYREMWIPKFGELEKGQRLVFIVDEAHANRNELPLFLSYLSNQGYNPLDFKECPSSQTTLSMEYPGNKRTFVLDVNKEQIW